MLSLKTSKLKCYLQDVEKNIFGLMANIKATKLWGGRFEAGLANEAELLSESISFDHKLYEFDILASQAHVKMLSSQGIISAKDSQEIYSALTMIKQEFSAGEVEFKLSLEDIHTHVETRLVELIGENGKRLHTGRSRNDQVAVDTHLYLKHNSLEQSKLVVELLQTIKNLASKNQENIWAGYTHTQIAQPVSLAHYLMGYFFKFERDLNELIKVLHDSDKSPLGCAALAGANYPLDRQMTAKLLGFNGVYDNSMDAISNRDYQLSYHFFATKLFIHISRLCEDLILYSTAEFQYVTFSDKVTTGSSIMPQKRNPDIAELLRGKSARVVGNLISLVTNLKSLPMTYNRDLQEDKIYLFDSVEQVTLSLKSLILILNEVSFNPEKVTENLKKGFSLATDFADFLVKEKNMPFRQSHELTGKLVRYCEDQDKYLEDLSTTEINKICELEVNLPQNYLDIKKSLSRKLSSGSTSPQSVKTQLEKASELILNLKKQVTSISPVPSKV